MCTILSDVLYPPDFGEYEGIEKYTGEEDVLEWVEEKQWRTRRREREERGVVVFFQYLLFAGYRGNSIACIKSFNLLYAIGTTMIIILKGEKSRFSCLWDFPKFRQIVIKKEPNPLYLSQNQCTLVTYKLCFLRPFFITSGPKVAESVTVKDTGNDFLLPHCFSPSHCWLSRI